ncbi:MAG: hypothetical protein ACOCVF_02660 [bacterium]
MITTWSEIKRFVNRLSDDKNFSKLDLYYYNKDLTKQTVISYLLKLERIGFIKRIGAYHLSRKRNNQVIYKRIQIIPPGLTTTQVDKLLIMKEDERKNYLRVLKIKEIKEKILNK